MLSRIVLLTSENGELKRTRYCSAFANEGLPAPVFVAPLRYTTVEESQEKLLDKLRGSDPSFGGIIVTSPRSAEYLRAACISLQVSTKLVYWWMKVPCYVVGQATLSVLESVQGICCEGAETGTAAKLAEYIIKKNSIRCGKQTDDALLSPFLFICGENRRNTLPDMMRAVSMEIVECVLYRSVPTLNIADHPTMKDIMDSVIGGDNSKIGHDKENLYWIVFFSPRGVDVVGNYCPEIFRLSSNCGLNNRIIFVAIGPTTATAISKHSEGTVVVASSPSADAIAKSISSFKLSI